MKAVITGISEPYGDSFSQLLLSKEYEVLGILSRNRTMLQGTVDILPGNIKNQIIINYGDTTVGNHLSNLLRMVKT